MCWIQPVTNVNFHNDKERELFAEKLRIFTSLYDNMSTLKLVQMWDPYNKSLYLGPQRRFTSEGKSLYWRALDKTIRFCDTNILKKTGNLQTYKNPGQYQQYRRFQPNRGRGKNTSWIHSRKQTHTVGSANSDLRYELPPPPGPLTIDTDEELD